MTAQGKLVGIWGSRLFAGGSPLLRGLVESGR